MAEKTYFIVQAFEKKGRRLVPAQPTQCKSAQEAVSRAERDTARFAGVVAFSQVADEETGETMDEPEFLFRQGDLPQEMSDE
ncbi:hypothetical protein [Fulvimarina sp. MAC3]|uniref:hypothetical protein n=1 Tax=Fulvimarina sp. MAC3 TaxID=3148887 RepID=UPI0031FD46E5